MKAFAITLAVFALAGCSSFKMGAACYIPHGVTGQCSMTTVQPGEPAKVEEKKTGT